MKVQTRVAVFLMLCASLVGNAYGKDLPNIDVFGNRQKVVGNDVALASKAKGLVKAGSRIQSESRLGVPTFLWAGSGPSVASIGLNTPKTNGLERAEVAAARGHLSHYATLYGLAGEDVGNAVVSMVQNTGKGPVIVKFRTEINGIEIFREELNVLMNKNLEHVAISGYISSTATPGLRGGSLAFGLDARSAAINAVRDMTGASLAASHLTAAGSRDGYDFFSVASASGAVLDEPVRMKKVYFHLPEGLEPAYYIEVIGQDGISTDTVSIDGPVATSGGYSYVISANDGSILFRKNLVSDAAPKRQPSANADLVNTSSGAYTYRVWADPITGIPYDTPAGNAVHPKVNPIPDGFQATFLPTQDVTLSNYTFSQNDPWLPPGSTETVGNNVDAFVNLINGVSPTYTATSDNGYGPVAPTPYDGVKTVPNGGGDFRAKITAADVFAHSTVAGTDPTTAVQRQGAIQQLFYNINFLHDWFYDSGFNEGGRNAQTNNFGRGGLGNDSIKAQVQDIAARNNANMLTPADGQRPRMRMYTFDSLAPRYIEVTAPAASFQKFGNVGTYQSGPQAFNFSADVVYESTGCTTITDAAGKIAMVDYTNAAGTSTVCTLTTKLNNVRNSGAIGFILVWQPSVPAQTVNITGVDPAWTIPTLNLSWNNAGVVKTLLTNNPSVTLHFRRDAGTDRDGALDNQIVFHEWGHYLSGRLIGNGSGLNTQQAAGMGEGWGDFTAMMLTVREEDTAIASNPTWNGVYALATYAESGGDTGDPINGNQGYYYGIRRAPYSTNMAKNGLTLKHIEDGQAMPAGVLTAPPNSEVHNTGEVWSAMLWECYASLLRDTQGTNPRLTFAQAQDRMKAYLVASLSMTPSSPTFIEARDAVLAAAYATDFTDYTKFYEAFAKRGAGLYAVAPDRYNATNTGVTESFVTGPELAFMSASLDDSVASCDHDGVLDSGDRGNLTVVLRNVGSTSLTATTATITSSTTGVSFPNGNTLSFPPSDPTGQTSASVRVALAPGIAGVQQLDFTINYTDTQLGAVTYAKVVGFRGNTNTILAASATDSVETNVNSWSVSSNPIFGPVAPWAPAAVTPLQHVWHYANPSAGSDEYLASPVFTVDGSGSVNVQFDHSWQFEFDSGGNYDGGIVEMSVNGGSYTDIGTTAYNGTLINYTNNVNPLKGRQAFVANSAGTVHTSLTQAVAPGSTVRIRFRAASDSAAGAPGWNIDNIAFTGVVETPFAVLVADSGCSLSTVTTISVSANPSPAGAPLTISAQVTAGGSGVGTGTVTFFDGANSLGTASIIGGTASITTSALTTGIHSLTARFDGSTGYLTSTSGSLSVTISKAASAISVVSSLNPSAPGQSVTFTATVSGSAATPTGSVNFYDGASLLGTAGMSGGVATYTTAALTGGSHTINATYAGNATYAASNASLTQNVVTGSTISFNPAAYSAFENAGTVTLTVTRTGGNTTGAASVAYTTTDGTAVAGGRYTTASGTVNFLANETSKTFTVSLINTSMIEGKQTFTVTLSSPSAAVLGTSTATVDIMDDDTRASDFSTVLDGKVDLLWRNANGDIRAWIMNGTALTTSVDLPRLGAGWVASGVGDFNADGHADIVWRHSTTFASVVWYMNGTNFVSSAALPTVPDANWKIVGIADMNRDGYPDLLWRHSVNFTMAAFLMRDNVLLSTTTLPTVADANWQLSGTGDFNRDGKTDLVWRNSNSRDVAVWFMNGTTLSSTAALPKAGAPWELVGVGDINSDGDSDLLWRTTTTRQMAVWYMNQTTMSSAAAMPTLNEPDWTLISPR